MANTVNIEELNRIEHERMLQALEWRAAKVDAALEHARKMTTKRFGVAQPPELVWSVARAILGLEGR